MEKSKSDSPDFHLMIHLTSMKLVAQRHAADQPPSISTATGNTCS